MMGGILSYCVLGQSLALGDQDIDACCFVREQLVILR